MFGFEFVASLATSQVFKSENYVGKLIYVKINLTCEFLFGIGIVWKCEIFVSRETWETVCRCFTNNLYTFQEAVDKLTELSERGEEMIKNDHYYSQSIKAKCNELQNIHNDLNQKFDERKHNLDKSTEVHESLQQVRCIINLGI